MCSRSQVGLIQAVEAVSLRIYLSDAGLRKTLSTRDPGKTSKCGPKISPMPNILDYSSPRFPHQSKKYRWIPSTAVNHSLLRSFCIDGEAIAFYFLSPGSCNEGEGGTRRPPEYPEPARHRGNARARPSGGAGDSPRCLDSPCSPTDCHERRFCRRGPHAGTVDNAFGSRRCCVGDPGFSTSSNSITACTCSDSDLGFSSGRAGRARVSSSGSSEIRSSSASATSGASSMGVCGGTGSTSSTSSESFRQQAQR